MTISKKLFLIAAIGLGLGSLNSICTESNNNPDQAIFDFAITVSQQEDATAQAIAQWLTEEIGNENFDKHKVTLIINSPLTLEEKIKYLNAMYLKTLQPNPMQQDTANNDIHAAIKTGLTLATMLAASAIVWPVALVISTKLKPQLIEHYFEYYNQMTGYLLPKLIRK